MIEFFAVIFSLFSVWLTIKESVFCWLIGSIGIIFYSIIFYQDCDYCNMTLQLLFLVQSFIGWKNWNKKWSPKISMFNKNLSISKYINLIILILTFSFIYYKISLYMGGSNLILDSITTSLSIAAMVFLIRKNIEAWALWIIADILYIRLFINSEHYMSAILYFIFLLMSIKGFVDWKKELMLKK